MDLIGHDRAFFVSDSMGAAGLDVKSYHLKGKPVDIINGAVYYPEDHSHFAASATTLADAIARAQKPLGLSDADVQKLAHDNPSRILNN